jgi:RNA polymerase sigma-70 factor (ECF subfamily)
VETLIHEYGRLVFHTIYGLTGDWEESQDLTQDTFHQALKGLEAAQAASGERFHAKAWLLSIALNTVRMQRRRRNIFRFIPFSRMREEETQTREVEFDALPVQPTGYGAVEQDDPAELIAERDTVHRTLARLPENFRVVLLLSIVSGLSTAEIARTLKMQEAAVRQRLVRARKQFQQLYTYESGEQLADPHPQSQSTQGEKSDPSSSTLRLQIAQIFL